MTKAQRLEEIGYTAMLSVRLDKLKRGRPFMINSPDLPSYQCYMEYSNGLITIEQIGHSGSDFEKIRELSYEEAALVRKAFGLTPFQA